MAASKRYLSATIVGPLIIQILFVDNKNRSNCS